MKKARPRAMWSVSDLVQMTGLSAKQVRRLLTSNQVHVDRIGTRWYVARASFRLAFPELHATIIENSCNAA